MGLRKANKTAVGWRIYVYFVHIAPMAVASRLGFLVGDIKFTDSLSSGFCTVGFGRQKDVRQKMNAGEFSFFFATYLFAILFGDTELLWLLAFNRYQVINSCRDTPLHSKYEPPRYGSPSIHRVAAHWARAYAYYQRPAKVGTTRPDKLNQDTILSRWKQ